MDELFNLCRASYSDVIFMILKQQQKKKEQIGVLLIIETLWRIKKKIPKKENFAFSFWTF